MIYLISPPANEPRKSYPYSLIYLSSYLRKNGLKSTVIDCDVLKYSVEDLIGQLKRDIPKVVGITGYSRYRFAAYEVIKNIKHHFPDCTIVVGGRHFSSLPKETLENLRDVDIVVSGEGEIPFFEVCNALLNRTSIHSIKGINYRLNGEIVSNDSQGFEKDIEQFSYDEKDLPKGPYHLKVPVSLKKGDEISNPVSVMTSRGCPGKCVYCCLSAGKVRYRNPIAVVDEIENNILKANTNEISISDSSFTVNNKHVITICEEILRRNLKIKWNCQSRANMDVEILKLMKSAGCAEMSVGVETASPKVLKAIQKKINLDQVMTFFQKCKELKISVVAYFMVSLPDENESDAEQTFNFIKEITPFIFKPALQVTQIYPDAKLYDIAKKKGVLPESFSWFKPYINPYVERLGGRENIPYYLEHLSVDYLEKYLERYQSYYLTHFYYKDEFKAYALKGMKSILFDWKNETASKKIKRIKNGLFATYGSLIKKN